MDKVSEKALNALTTVHILVYTALLAVIAYEYVQKKKMKKAEHSCCDGECCGLEDSFE